MIQTGIILDGDGCWPDARPDNPQCEFIEYPISIDFARLRKGVQSGASSVTIRINRPDGTFVITQTSMKNFLAVAQAFQTKEEIENGY